MKLVRVVGSWCSHVVGTWVMGTVPGKALWKDTARDIVCLHPLT